MFRSFAHFLMVLFGFLLLSCMCSLYFLHVNPCQICKYFFHSVDLFFMLLMIFLAVQKPFSLTEFPTCLFFALFLLFLPFVVKSKNSSATYVEKLTVHVLL